MPVSGPAAESPGFDHLLFSAFRRPGWHAHRPVRGVDGYTGMLVNAASGNFLVGLKVAPEGRSDRLIPILSQAILQVQSAAREQSAQVVPVAVIASRRIPLSVAGQVQSFAAKYAPGVGIGVIDAEGLRRFAGPGLEGLDFSPSQRIVKRAASPKRPADLFSDLNQWMLKILLGQSLPAEMISVPRGPVTNASRLAALAKVSVMSATRLVNQLEEEGLLERYADRLEVVRVPEILERWRGAAQDNRRMASAPARFLVRMDQKQFLENARKSAGGKSAGGKSARGKSAEKQHRCCLALFAAADAHGLGFVRGVPPCLYLESFDAPVLRGLGLAVQDSAQSSDVMLRVPVNGESIFRAAALRDGLPVSDILQVWLDCSSHPARGREQADEIWRRILKPAFAVRKAARGKR